MLRLISIDREGEGPDLVHNQTRDIGAVVVDIDENYNPKIIDHFHGSIKRKDTTDEEIIHKATQIIMHEKDPLKFKIRSTCQRTRKEFWDKHPELDKKIEENGRKESVVFREFHQFLLKNINKNTKYLTDNPAYDIAGLSVGLNFLCLPSMEYINGDYVGFGIDLDGMEDALTLANIKVPTHVDLAALLDTIKYEKCEHDPVYDAIKNVARYCDICKGVTRSELKLASFPPSTPLGSGGKIN